MAYLSRRNLVLSCIGKKKQIIPHPIHITLYSFVPSFQMDYSTMYHILLEYSITLHVFNDELFDIPKATERSKLYGETTEPFGM